VKRSNLVHIGNLGRRNWPYVVTWIIYYAWVIVFTTWWTASPITDEVYSTDIRAMLHSINLLASAFFVVIMKKDWFVRFSKIGAICVSVSAVLFLTVTSPALHLAVIVLLGVSLGIVNAGILMPFVFALNNTEKFYAVMGTNLLISVLVLLQETQVLNITNGMLPSLVMLFLGLAPLHWFHRSDLDAAAPVQTHTAPKTKKILYVTIILNCLYAVLCKGIGRMFVLAADGRVPFNLNVVFYLGAIAGCGVYFLIYALFRHGNLITWNVTFGAFVIAMVVHMAGQSSAPAAVALAVLLGIGSTMGMINMYYILGVIGKKYQSQTYVKVSVVFIGCVGGITGVLLGKWGTNYPDSIAIAVAAISSVVIVLLLMLSPTLSRTYFNEGWAEDSQKPEVDNEWAYLFAQYDLSKREIEVCRMLLEGYTLRQTAARLGIAYPTANTYQTSLYRKLGINSKTELLLHFKDYLTK